MEVELVSNLLTRNLWMAGDLKMMLSPKIGNLLPVEGLNNFLSFFFGGSGCTQRDCNHPVFPKNWRKCPSVRQSWRLSFGPDHPGWCKSNGRLGRMCKLVCHFDQTLRIRVWYIYIYRIYIWATFTTRVFTIHVGLHTPVPYMDPTWKKVQKKVAQFPWSF